VLRGHGPELPYRIVGGVVPCRGNWLVASCKLQGSNVSVEDPKLYQAFTDVIDEKPAFDTLGVFAPIGYLDEGVPGGRMCDREARALLGPRRGAAIRSAPSWLTFESSAGKTGDHLDAATSVLLPLYRQIASEMAPYRQRSIFEVNPELTFYELNDDKPLRYSKRLKLGRLERGALLEQKFQGVERIIDSNLSGTSAAHLIDATACMWSARRIIVRAAVRLPMDPEWDSQGLRMELVR
jgi:predicted RNase H-like nuclease